MDRCINECLDIISQKVVDAFLITQCNINKSLPCVWLFLTKTVILFSFAVQNLFMQCWSLMHALHYITYYYYKHNHYVSNKGVKFHVQICIFFFMFINTKRNWHIFSKLTSTMHNSQDMQYNNCFLCLKKFVYMFQCSKETTLPIIFRIETYMSNTITLLIFLLNL